VYFFLVSVAIRWYVLSCFIIFVIITSGFSCSSIRTLKFEILPRHQKRLGTTDLEYYNKLFLQVEPFLQVVEKLFNANKELGLDAFKSSLTLPGLTLQLMFSDLPPGVYFTLINQSNSNLHQLIKKNVCGGLSVVFHREHQADITYIRHREFGDNAKLCKKILG